ncbi:hypothetical protein DSO57_1034230 [Entomophthora muscae]|uniref:Uncharacterized protein n=1 Tax=Entomophthora muscae TaxID=34485 RepID=A0ACC2TAX6_9FUNG|nr:hypothetical protein DSO57_1034230 [Entomophthora muscae]
MTNFLIFVAVAAGQLHNLYPAKAAVFRHDSPLRFLAKIKMRGSTICSGAMYRENVVITTATHLQQPRKLYKVNVPKFTDSLRYLNYNVLDIHIHSNFSFSSKPKSNLAIVILKRTEA